MKKLLFIFLFPILAFGQKAFQPKSNGWWYLQGITTKPTHNLIGVRDSNSTSDKAQIRLFGDVTIKNLAGVGYATFDANGKIGKSILTTDVQGIGDARYTQLLKTFKTIAVNSAATETDLQSYTIPANTLADGETIEFTSSITAAGSGGQYTIYLKNINYYGVGLTAGSRITSIVRMTRDGTNANYSITVTGSVNTVQSGTITFDATVANINKVTGQGTATNDLTAYVGNVIKLPFK